MAKILAPSSLSATTPYWSGKVSHLEEHGPGRQHGRMALILFVWKFAKMLYSSNISWASCVFFLKLGVGSK